MSVRRDTSGDAAAAMAAGVGSGQMAFLDGRGPTPEERSDPAFMVGWQMAAEKAAGELVDLRARMRNIEAEREAAKRDASAIVDNAALVRHALEAAIPAWNLCKPAKPNPRQSALIADAIAKTEAALAAVNAAAEALKTKASPHAGASVAHSATAPARKRNSGRGPATNKQVQPGERAAG